MDAIEGIFMQFLHKPCVKTLKSPDIPTPSEIGPPSLEPMGY